MLPEDVAGQMADSAARNKLIVQTYKAKEKEYGQTKTVFLARPTVSTILMTQMIGRALRGEAAGGTSLAYIVSFVDNWNEHIAWVNPDSLFSGNNEFTDNLTERMKHELRMIAISKIEEFASVLDDSVDTTVLEKVPFVQRIPIGMYEFTYLEENGVDFLSGRPCDTDE